MKHLKAYKTKLNLNNEEENKMRQCAGAVRFVFNWGLAEWQTMYEAHKLDETLPKPSAYTLKKRFNAEKDELAPWIRELPYVITQEAFIDLGNAFKGFFRRVKKGELGYPKFKSRGNPRQSFRFIGGATVTPTHIKLPKLGWLRLAEHSYLPTDRRIKQATVSCYANQWYVSVLVEEDIEPLTTTGERIGLDIGTKTAVVSSDGTFYANQRTLRKYEAKMKRLQRELSRRKKGGENWRKTKAKITRLHKKISDTRNHARHNVTRDIVVNKRPSVIVLEDLAVQNMTAKSKPKPDPENEGHYLPNRKKQKAGLNRSLLEVAPYELRRQIEYKSKWAGSQVIVANRWFPSSKTCSNCGAVDGELTLADREYNCKNCGHVIDRDLNAAINLAQYSEDWQPVK